MSVRVANGSMNIASSNMASRSEEINNKVDPSGLHQPRIRCNQCLGNYYYSLCHVFTYYYIFSN
jgi:hypothetical protein